MKKDHSNYGRLIAVFFLGVLLFTYPILSLFDHPDLMFGVPLLFLYLFVAWIGLIALIFLVITKPPGSLQAGTPPTRPPSKHKGR